MEVLEMPNWLPPCFCVNPWNGDTYEALYAIFCQDIRNYHLKYRTYEVWIFSEKDDGKEKLFWHLTTRKQKIKNIPRRKQKVIQTQQNQVQRLPDFRRCERLPWIKPMIENPSDPKVLVWDYEEGDRAIKTYIWLKHRDFVVIMKKYSNGRRRLITSFYVDKQYKKDDFERKYTNRI
jgi:hypothetical protein